MAQRKLQQEIDKTFKKVAEGIAAFDAIYEKIYSVDKTAQKDKLEDNLKREIKKLQRFRDQIKTWAAGNEIKDKKPLLEQRKAIETCMEQFKAVEKEMKTKAYSKEGLSAGAKLDPKEKEKLEAGNFLSSMVDELERQVESLEAEDENLHAGVKKGKKDNTKMDRISEIAEKLEKHKWHQGKLELLLRALENGKVEPNQIMDLQEDIKYYVNENSNVDYVDNDELYDDLNLEEEEGQFGMGGELDRLSSQDAQSTADDADVEPGRPATKMKSADAGPAGGRRPSNQLKSPLPALATLHSMNTATVTPATNAMKPAPLPTRAPGETLKYASAAAAAAASDKHGMGIAPLPPPPNAATGLVPLPPAKTSNTVSPAPQQSAVSSQKPPPLTAPPAPSSDEPLSAQTQSKSPTLSQSDVGALSVPSSVPETPAMEKVEKVDSIAGSMKTGPLDKEPSIPEPVADPSTTNGAVNEEQEAEESIYHLPPGLQDLIQSFEITKNRVSQSQGISPADMRMLQASRDSAPGPTDSEKPRRYRPQIRYNTPSYYSQEIPPILDDPRLYETGRVDTDTLFYIFYYRQGSYQQYLAAKALKNQSWRFHKQYQTWFQRHEEPKNITDEFEQGTYRFFDYESTWMNRRKADFKFVYKFLEDDL